MIPCGVVDEDAYLSSSSKIVFVLKEPHEESHTHPWTIPNSLKRNVDHGNSGFEKGFAYTWNQAGVWAFAIHNGFKSYKELNKPGSIPEGINTIGMTNLKKTGGGATARYSEIKEHALRHQSLWKKELEIMNPDLIICGGTYGLVIKGLQLQNEPLIKIGRKQYCFARWFREGHCSIVLRFLHPAYWFHRPENLLLLSQLIAKLKEQGLLTHYLQPSVPPKFIKIGLS